MTELQNEIQTEFESCECATPIDQFNALARIGGRRLADADDATPIIDTIMQIYDSVVAPFDIPGLPNLIEPAVDKAIGQALRMLLERIAERLKKRHEG